MRFLNMLKLDETMPAGPPPLSLMTAIEAFGEEATKAGVLIDQGGLAPTSAGARISAVAGAVSVTDGPFTETKEIIGGWAMFETRTREEAIEWGRRFVELHAVHWPQMPVVAEVRQVMEPGDFDPASLGG